MRILVWLLSAAAVASESLTSELWTMPTVGHARSLCDHTMACAGLTYRIADIVDAQGHNTTELHAYTHAFITTNASVPEGEEDMGWEVYVSQKPYVLQQGKVSSQRLLTDLDFDKTTLTLQQAKDMCTEHPDCIAFSYETHSMRLTGFETIEFYATVDHMLDYPRDEWRTFVVNDPQKADLMNLEVIFWDDDQYEEPYKSCCDRVVYNQTTQEPVIPTIEELKAVDTLPRISCDISPHDFYEKYEKTRTPVMLVGCADHWPAQERWTLEHLSARFANDTTWRAKIGDEDYNVELPFARIKQAIADEQKFYIFDQLDHEAGQDLARDYQTPYPFQGKSLYPDDFPPNNYGSLRWFVMGPPHSGTHPHRDPFATDAWNTVIRGHKWWILYPSIIEHPRSIQCHTSCSPEGAALKEWYLSVGQNAARTVYRQGGKDVSPQIILQSPGETIYVPHEFTHSVFNMDATTGVTANFGSAGNLERVWQSMIHYGTDDQLQRLFFQRLNSEQRDFLKAGKYWPPNDFQDVDGKGVGLEVFDGYA